MTKRFFLLSSLVSLICLSSAVAQSPASDLLDGRYWLQLNGLEAWEWEVDGDLDGMSNREEYFAGTDPKDAASKLRTGITTEDDAIVVSWDGLPGAIYDFVGSDDLNSWASLIVEPLAGSGEVIEVEVALESEREFFGLQPLPSPDTDGDGLSDREEALLGTRPDLEDTDGDTFSDGREVFQTLTDPLVFNPLGGTISGTVLLDEDTDGDLTGADPVPGVTVFLDLNFNAELDDDEPRQETAADGSYAFSRLLPGLYEVRQQLFPGEIQTVPADVTPVVPDRLADEVVEYTHAPGVLAEAYGFRPRDDWPGFNFVDLNRMIEPVDPGVLLTPFDERLSNPPIGVGTLSHHLALPDGASVTVRFDEIIYDGPGVDFIIGFPRNGEGTTSGEPAEFGIGPASDELITYTHTDLLGASIPRFAEVDLANFPELPFVQFLKVTSQTTGDTLGGQNSDGGFGLGGFQAINVLPLTTSARRLRIIGGETIADQNFGRFLQDFAPTILLSTSTQAQAGQAFSFRFIVNDDLGLGPVTASANGSAVTLDSDFAASVTPAFPGEMTLTATATDTRGQSTTESWTLFILDENGELPFDPLDLAEQQGAGLTSIKIFTPASGDVPTGDTEIVGSIVAPSGSTPDWSVSYAPIALIDPLDLVTPDPDYIEIATGTGNQYSTSLGTLPISTLDPGIYFLKTVATPAGGGLSNLVGQVFGVGIDEATLRPRITFEEPQPGAVASLVQPVRVGLESDRPITEWSIEVAAYEEVDLTDLGGPSDAWIGIASGTGAFALADVANLDTSGLRNGRYLLRLTAFNDLRLGRVDTVDFEISSPVKPGRNRAEFTDADIVLAGFPLSLTRVYDSLEADNERDFGFGWSFSLGDPEIFETVPDTGDSIFGATPFVNGTRVFLTAPDGQRLGFTFEPKFAVASFIGALFRVEFTPDPGNPYTLEVPEGDAGFLAITQTGEARLGLLGFPWNPDRYLLTAQDGTRYTYEQREGLLLVEDTSGNSLTFTDDAVTHSSGLALTFTRDAEGRITQVAEPDTDRVWFYRYSAEGNLIAVIDPDLEFSKYNYDLAGFPHHLTTFTSANGRPGRSFEYDAAGRITAIIDERGNREEQAWDPAMRSLTVTDRRGNETRLVFDDRGNVTEQIDPFGNITLSEYNDPRHPDLETEVNTENSRVRFKLDAKGRTIEVRYADDFFEDLAISYDDFGNPLSFTELGGRKRFFEYDDQGRLTKIPHIGFPNAFQETRTYNDDGKLESVTNGGLTLFTTYDSLTGLKSREYTDTGFDRRYTYNENGQPLTITDSNGETSTITYTPECGEFNIEYENGGTNTFTNLNFLKLVGGGGGGGGGGATLDIDSIPPPPPPKFGVTDALGGLIVIDYDDRDNEVKRTLPNTAEISRAYDAEDNLTSITVPGGHTNTITYDALNNPVALTDADGATLNVTRNAEGLITERVNRNGKRITYTYNKRGQVTAERWHEGAEIVREFTYTYGFGGGFLREVTDGSSVWKMSSQNFSRVLTDFDFNYDGQDRFYVGIQPEGSRPELTNRVRIVNNDASTVDGPQLEIRGYLVNRRSHQPQITITAGSPTVNASVRQRYDAEGRITAVERYDIFGTSTFSVQPVSETLVTRMPMGVSGAVRHQDAAGVLAFPGSEFIFGRDLKNRVTSRTQPTNTTSYTYDTTDQVLTAAHTGFTDESFTYDIAGNAAAGTYGADNRLLTLGTLSFTYDGEGNITAQTDSATGRVKSYTYDHRNQLTSVTIKEDAAATPVIVLEYEYDFVGRIMSRTTGGEKFWLLYEKATAVAEFRDGESSLSSVLFYDFANPLNRFARWTDTDGFRWFLTDALGTVNGILAHDGTPLHWIDYDTYGAPRTAVPAGFGPHRFAGQLYNEAAGLYENGLRHYNPEIQRFQQQDPIRYLSNDPNLYRYAENNPISKTDPLGTNAAIEYAILAGNVGLCIESILKFSNCVEALLGGVNNAIAAGGGCVEIKCVAGLGGGSGCVGQALPAPGAAGSAPPGFGEFAEDAAQQTLEFLGGAGLGVPQGAALTGFAPTPSFCP